jgi:hypothetical protein
MSDVVERPRPIFPAFVAAWSLLALTSFAVGLTRANRTTLRGDEIVTLTQYLRAQSLRDLIVKGAAQQVSPAPLLYLADATLDVSRGRLNYLGLTPQGYMRLPSLVFTAGLGLAAALAVGLRIRKQNGTLLQYFFVLCGLAIFYFHPKVFAFAGTERPYGLWNGLWLFLLAWLLGRPPAPRVPLIVLSLMAATATAACFQILAVGIALVVVRRVEGKSAKEILKEGALLLALPAAIGAYYALRSEQASYEELGYGEKIPRFLRFWLLGNLHVWIAGGAMTWLALKRPALRELAIPPVALTALIIVMPLVFTLAHMKGYTMVSRQYIWTSTAVPLALFFTAIAWPELKPSRYLRALTVLAAVAIVAGNLVATFNRPLRNDSRYLALLEKDGPLMTTLRTERPDAFLSNLEDIENKNLKLLVEWIGVRYGHLPKGKIKFAILDRNGRLEAEPKGDRWPKDFEKRMWFTPFD